MTSDADYAVQPGGIEIPSTTAITHATDQQKNRGKQRDSASKPKKKRRKRAPDVDAGLPKMEAENSDDNEYSSRVDYLA